MRIQYKATKHRMTVKDETGRRLVAAGIAVEVEDKKKRKPAEVKAEPAPKRRTYRRRDMQAAVPDAPSSYLTRDERAEEE